MSDALDKQVGGDWYKSMAIQPSVYCERNKLSHLQSQVVKYISRTGKKGEEEQEIEDMEKAIHCIEMRIQLLKEGLI